MSDLGMIKNKPYVAIVIDEYFVASDVGSFQEIEVRKKLHISTGSWYIISIRFSNSG